MSRPVRNWSIRIIRNGSKANCFVCLIVMAANTKRMLTVDNGPGTNGLRGGVKEYNPKTATGSWMETYGGPIGYKRGFTNSEFETEAQHAQLGALQKPIAYFGAGIPLLDDRDSNGNVNSSAKTAVSMWSSTTRDVHKNLGTIRKVCKQPVTVNRSIYHILFYEGRRTIRAVEATIE